MTHKTINIAYTSDDWRGVALSNFSLSPFLLGGVLLASIEGFIQGIKFPHSHPTRAQAFTLTAWQAKECGQGAIKDVVHWQNLKIPFGSADHHRLVERALRTKFAQNQGLCHVLQATQGLTILHQTGEGAEPALTSIPASEFCRVLTDIRAGLM